MYMNLHHVDGITYKQLREYFGKPDDEKFFSDDTQEMAEWKLSLFGVKIKININSSKWAMDNWDKKSYKVPDVKNDFVNSIEIMGNFKFCKDVVIPFIEYEFKNRKNDLGRSIKYIFEEL